MILNLKLEKEKQEIVFMLRLFDLSSSINEVLFDQLLQGKENGSCLLGMHWLPMNTGTHLCVVNRI